MTKEAVQEIKLDSQDITKLIETTNKLVTRIDKLVMLFEDASKHLDEVQTTEAKVNALATKLEILLDQNKSIAQGLLLLEKYVRGKSGMSSPQPPQMSQFQ